MRLLAALAVGLVVLAGPGHAQPRVTKADGDRFQAKLARIVSLGNAPAGRARAAQNTAITDTEVNSYLRFHARTRSRSASSSPRCTRTATASCPGRAIVDLDAVRKQKQRGWLDPMGYLTGRLPVTARGTLTTKDGIGRFELESAEIVRA